MLLESHVHLPSVSCHIADTRSGLSPTPLAQIPVQAKVLCSQRGNSSSDQPSCSIKNNQLAVLKPRDTLNLSLSLRTVYFETLVTFNHYPWPEWGSVLDAFQDVTINNGDSLPLVWQMLQERDRKALHLQWAWHAVTPWASETLMLSLI